MMKRVFDLMVTFILIVLLSPVMGLTAILVRMKLGTPVLFKQQRPGKNGQLMQLYKFRTMIDKKDENGEWLPDEQRMTSFGQVLRKISLDELPQLFNVLKGDLSLVGPRPLLVEYLDLYTPEQARRHEVRPGITGWAQVNGRNAITWEEKFALDVWYVDHQSFFLDVKIMFMTIQRVFQKEGINQEGHVSIEKFTGSRGAKWQSS